ncbi:hypothetical protein HA466_0020820 [Hirschfeldia incana]|nr:hypothetical protein HA466_0020820 [Hirschfeldia incana]
MYKRTGPEYVGGILALVFDVDFDENSTRVDFVRVQLLWNVDNPLRFQRNFQFSANVNTLLSFRYERLRNFCQTCGLLSHERQDCPLGDDGDQPPADSDDDNDDGGDDANGDDDGPAPADTNLDPDNDSNSPPLEMQGFDGEDMVQGEAQGLKRKRDDASTKDQYAAFEDEEMEEISAYDEGAVVPGEAVMKNTFIEELLDGSSSLVGSITGAGNDLGLLDMKQNYGFGPLFDQYRSFTGAPIFYQSWAEEIDVCHLEYVVTPPLTKRSRMDDMVVDKFQVGKKIISPEFCALQKISEDYGEDELLMEDSNPIDRGAVGPVPPPGQ